LKRAATFLCSGLFIALLPLEGARAVPNGGYRVEMAPLVLLAGGGETLGADRTVTPGDLVMTTGIGVARAAHVENPATVTVAGITRSLSDNSLLVGATLVGEAAPGGIFCAGAERPDKISRDEVRPGLGKRFRAIVQLCLVDANNDGVFEKAFVAGAMWPQENGMIDIPAIRYRGISNAPLRDSWFHVTFEKGAPLQGPVLNIDAQITGQRVNLAFAKIGADRSSMRKYPVERSVKRQYPYTMELGDARITLKGFEPESRQLQLSVDKPFQTRFLDFEMINYTIYIYH